MVNEIATIAVICFIGFVLSIYALSVEKKKNANKNYKSVCDINDRASCTKAFTSKYGKTFGISNSIYGMVFYILVLILLFFGFYNYIFYLAIFGMLKTIYLAYALFFKLKDLCIVCSLIYTVNILLLIFSYLAAY